jgi:hypothetical protein
MYEITHVSTVDRVEETHASKREKAATLMKSPESSLAGVNSDQSFAIDYGVAQARRSHPTRAFRSSFNNLARNLGLKRAAVDP